MSVSDKSCEVCGGMQRWNGKVAVVTGASSGIGSSIVVALVKRGLHVAGLARRVDKIQELCDSISECSGKLYPIKCDVSKENEILEAFSKIKKDLGGVDILVNCAGVINDSLLSDGKTSDWQNILDVNILGLSICTREALMIMKEQKQDNGHIIHINSIAGHYYPMKPGMHMYSASKHAVTALTEGLRVELGAQQSRIRITSISPGLTDTEIFRRGMNPAEADKIYKKIPHLKPEDVASTVVFALAAPPHVQIHELTVKPVGEINL